MSLGESHREAGVLTECVRVPDLPLMDRPGVESPLQSQAGRWVSVGPLALPLRVE